MKSRMNHPAMMIPEAMQALQALGKATEAAGEAAKACGLAELRVGQLNGCSVCVDMHARLLKMGGESDERLFAVGAWRDAPYFSDAERAALDLAESVTCLSDRANPVPDAIWAEAARQFTEPELARLLLRIALVNLWTRLNLATKQVAGEWMKSAEARKWVEQAAADR